MAITKNKNYNMINDVLSIIIDDDLTHCSFSRQLFLMDSNSIKTNVNVIKTKLYFLTILLEAA
jgi:hypothetical protein